ncbi:MAG: acetyl-CoA acetyltransferase, partial [Gammaproteobacteria bacterium]|nr:acetyl-CoA acetyltransferase [Gammaproteobacteria bacterium]
MPDSSRIPVIIGVGQSVCREKPASVADLPDIESMAAEACKAALADGGIENATSKIDTLAFIRLVADSLPSSPPIFGRCNQPPLTLARRLGASPAHAIYSELGGQAPQRLIHEASNRIASGESSLVLITGAEVTGAMKHALRQGWNIPEPALIDGEMDNRDTGFDVISQYELANGLTLPPDIYGMMENAWRHEHGLTRSEHRRRMAELLTRFSAVAAQNPYAMYPTTRDADFLATPSADNYHVADPYLKWSVAQDAVNQGAAVVVASVKMARDLGVPEEKWVYPLTGADAVDKLVIHRQHLGRSDMMSSTITQCLASAGVKVDDIAHMDLYSCFPCAAHFACDALGIDPLVRQVTQTGGLAFFGGAGNNYTLHAIANLVTTLRSDPGSLGLIVANGGYLSKASAGLYSTDQRDGWHPVNNSELQARLNTTP